MPGAAKKPPGPLTQAIAEILRGTRARKKIPAARIAASVGISGPQMSRILDGQKQIDLELLEAICEALDLDVMAVVKEADEATSARHLAR